VLALSLVMLKKNAFGQKLDGLSDSPNQVETLSKVTRILINQW
jgi:hypothetical protein